VYLSFTVVLPLYFVNSLRLCLPSLSFLSFIRQFFNFFVFLNRSFSYLRHCCIFVFRCRSFSFLRRCYLIIFRSSTVFRQFSPTLFAFYVVPCLSYLSPLISLSLSVVLSFTYATAVYLSFVVVLSLYYVAAILLSFARPLYFVNSLRLCLLCLSLFVFLALDVSVLCFPKWFFSFLHHSCTLFALSVVFVFLALDVSVLCFPKSFHFFLTSPLCVCLPLSASRCISSNFSDFVSSLCPSFFLTSVL